MSQMDQAPLGGDIGVELHYKQAQSAVEE